MDDKAFLEALRAVMREEIDRALEAKLDEKLKTVKDEIMLDFNAVIENKVSKEIRLIAEQHGDIVARLPDVEEQAELKSRVRVLEHFVFDLRAEVDKLKKAE